MNVWCGRLRCVLFWFLGGALDHVWLFFGLFFGWSFRGWPGFRCRFRIRFRRRFRIRFRCRFGFRFGFRYGFWWLL
jgi:hypothetical protein